jgi:AraC-like DNA-binding protein
VARHLDEEQTRTDADERLFVRLAEDDVHGPETGAPPNTLHAAPVIEALRPYVAHILIYRERVAPGREIVERVVPDGALRLVINLGDTPDESPPLAIIGPSAAPALVRLAGELHGLSVTFRPGVADAMLGVPAGALAASQVGLDALWGRRATARLDHVREATTDVARADVLQELLLTSLGSIPPLPAPTSLDRLQQAIAAARGDTVRELASAAGVGERRLQQIFHHHIGLPPRTWRRLTRLHACIRSLRHCAHIRWADVALEHGFYDQAHLVREFQDLCGCTPTTFRRRAISRSSKTAS